MKNVIHAINSRDGNALSRFIGEQKEPDRGVNNDAERLVDILFNNLKQLFPASVSTTLKTPEAESSAKRQWIAAFAENGIRTKEQLKAGMQHARLS